MMYIDGHWVNAVSGETFSAYNPSNGEKIGEAALSTIRIPLQGVSVDDGAQRTPGTGDDRGTG